MNGKQSCSIRSTPRGQVAESRYLVGPGRSLQTGRDQADDSPLIVVAPVAARTIRTPYDGVSHTTGEGPEGQSWISDDGVLHQRGGVSYWYDDVSDARLSGEVTLTVNFNFKLTAPPVAVYGPMWGTARLENEDGYWEGHWVGKRTEEGFSYIRVLMQGHGDYEGLQARANYVHETTDDSVPYTVRGVVMEPGGK